MLGLTGRLGPDVVAKAKSREGKKEGPDDPSAVRFRVRRREAPSPSFKGSGERLEPRSFLGGTRSWQSQTSQRYPSNVPSREAFGSVVASPATASTRTKRSSGSAATRRSRARA